MTVGGPPLRLDGEADARGRIVGVAYDLFSRFGFRAVGVNQIVAEARVAKTTLYHHFRSKEELGVSVLQRREQLWTHDWLERELRERADTPTGQLLACFDAFDEWFHRSDFEGCLFASTVVEARDPASAVKAAGVRGLEDVRRLLRELAAAAKARDPDALARQWQLLLLGAIVAASAGDLDAARRAHELGALLLQGEGLGP
jgi:AcrR family transcriptional regulator